MASDIVGQSDPHEVLRVRQKYLAIKRAEWRLKQRLETIDHEFDVIRPGLEALEQRVTVLGELPEFRFEDDDGDPENPLES